MDRARSNHSAKKNRTGGEERRGGQRKAEERREYRSKPCWMSWAEGNLGRDWRQRHACPTCQVIVSSSYLARRAKHDVPPCNRAKNPVTGLSKVTFDWTFTPFEVIVLGNFTLDGIVTGLLRGRTACNARRVHVSNALPAEVEV